MVQILELIKAAILFLVYTVGRRQGVESVEAYTNKKALDEATKALADREVIRAKTRELKDSIPDSWGDDGLPAADTGKHP